MELIEICGIDRDWWGDWELGGGFGCGVKWSLVLSFFVGFLRLLFKCGDWIVGECGWGDFICFMDFLSGIFFGFFVIGK